MDTNKAQIALLEDLVNGWLIADPYRIPAIRDSQDFKGDLICWQENHVHMAWEDKKMFQLDNNGVESSEAVLPLDS